MVGMEGFSDNSSSDRLVKNRRILMLVSIIFLLLVTAKGEMTRMSILGNVVEFHDPKTPVFLLFVALTYLLIKNFQLIHEIGGTGLKNKLRDFVSYELQDLAKRRADKDAGGDSGYPKERYDIVKRISIFRYVIVENTDINQAKNNTNTVEENQRKFKLELFDILPTYIRGIIYVIMRTTWVSEYLVPTLLGVMGMCIYIFDIDFSLSLIKP